MTQQSVTAGESLAARAQRREASRVVLWTIVLIGMLLLTLARRGLGGIVMSANQMFVPYASVLVVAIAAEFVLLWKLRRANRAGVLLPRWVWRASAIFDLAVPMAGLTIPSFFSPRGAGAGPSAPPLLLVPLVVLMSVLHLRPMLTLYMGLTAAGFHMLLAA